MAQPLKSRVLVRVRVGRVRVRAVYKRASKATTWQRNSSGILNISPCYLYATVCNIVRCLCLNNIH